MLNIEANAMSNTSIIGGADGPTAVFLAGRLGNSLLGAAIIGAVLIIIGIVFIASNKKS